MGILLEPTAFRGLRGKIIFRRFYQPTLWKRNWCLYQDGNHEIFSWKFDSRLNRAWNIYVAMPLGLINVILFSRTAEDTTFEAIFRDTSFLISFQVFFKSLIFVWK